MLPTVAYLASGKLYLKREGRSEELIESAFAQEMVEDAVRRRQKNEWKTRSMTGQIMSGGGMFGQRMIEGETRRIHISGVTRGRRPGELLYALDTDQTGGLFVYDIAGKQEQRLYHDHRFVAQHLARQPDGPLLAFSRRQDDGTAALAVINLDTNELHTATEGDSLDEAPAWLPDGKRLVFQSAGLARNQQGVVAGIGPYAVQKMVLDGEEMETLAEDPHRDYLLPRMTPDGSLYYLRRPYQGLPKGSGWAILRDIVMLPVALVMAVFGFLNFFSLMFSGKPLLTAGGPKREGPEPRHVMLLGKMVDAEKAERRARKGEPAALVPDDWELVRRSPDGAEAVLCGGVVSYDLCEDGSVVFTNGSAVYHRDAAGKRRLLHEGRLIEHVVAVG